MRAADQEQPPDEEREGETVRHEGHVGPGPHVGEQDSDGEDAGHGGGERCARDTVDAARANENLGARKCGDVELRRERGSGFGRAEPF